MRRPRTGVPQLGSAFAVRPPGEHVPCLGRVAKSFANRFPSLPSLTAAPICSQMFVLRNLNRACRCTTLFRYWWSADDIGLLGENRRAHNRAMGENASHIP